MLIHRFIVQKTLDPELVETSVLEPVVVNRKGRPVATLRKTITGMR
jgi:hypothetical protein